MATINLPVGVEWTPAILEELSREYRYEVSEGNLVMAAAAMRPWHEDAQARLRCLLRTQGRFACMEQGIIIERGEIYTCDVGVLRDPPAPQVAYHPAREFELVVEVISPDSQTTDRVVKPLKYAAAGIPEFWRVEEGDDGEAVVYQHRLVRTDDDVRYAESRVVLLSTLEKESV